jgi:hypothetical protein
MKSAKIIIISVLISCLIVFGALVSALYYKVGSLDMMFYLVTDTAPDAQEKLAEGDAFTPLIANLINLASGRLAVTAADLIAIDTSWIPDGYRTQLWCKTDMGDGGGGPFYFIEDDTTATNEGTYYQATDAGGVWKRDYTGPVNLKWFGATGNGSTNDRTAIYNWLNYGISTGETLYAPIGDYLQSTAIAFTGIDEDIEIILDRGAKIIGGAFADSVWKFTADALNTYSFKLRGGYFDTSGTTYNPAAASGTGLHLYAFREVDIDGTTFKAEDTYEDSQDNTHGDSGIAMSKCYDATVQNCNFIGHPDVGIYITGYDNVARTDDGGRINIINNHFSYNNVGVTARRQCSYLNITNNTFYRDLKGVQLADAGAALGSGESATISNNTFKYMGRTAIDVRYGRGSVITNNLIEDWGYDLDDVKDGFPYGIWVLGLKDSIISNNIIRLEDWADDDHSGILLNRYEFDSTYYGPTDNIISYNYISNVEYGINEAHATSENLYLFNYFDTVTDEYTLLNDDSLVISVDQDNVRLSSDEYFVIGDDEDEGAVRFKLNDTENAFSMTPYDGAAWDTDKQISYDADNGYWEIEGDLHVTGSYYLDLTNEVIDEDGNMRGGSLVTQVSTNTVLTAADMNQMFLVTAACTITLPDCGADSIGDFATFLVRDAGEAVIWDLTDASDKMRMPDGTEMAADAEIDAADAQAGNELYKCMCITINRWYWFSEHTMVDD